MSTPGGNARNESALWTAAYGGDEQIRRRRAAMPAKLARLGVLGCSRDLRILDLCCGNGEALDALHGMGFRNLQGLDAAVPPALAGDRRFRVKAGDAMASGYADGSFDWILCIHAMHHFATAANVGAFLAECRRILAPAGHLGIVDFAPSLRIRLAFRFFRQDRFLWTTYLKSFHTLIQEEWPFLKGYFGQWPEVRRMLWQGRFEVVSNRRTLFYFHLHLAKRTPH
jgi:SAM-dependent methyltransferase